MFAADRVQRAGRLVGEEDRGAGDQGAGQRDALGLPTGQLAGPAPFQPFQA